MSLEKAGQATTLPVMLSAFFFILKVAGTISWSWIWVFAPIWGYVGIIALLVLIDEVF